MPPLFIRKILNYVKFIIIYITFKKNDIFLNDRKIIAVFTIKGINIPNSKRERTKISEE